MSSVNKLTPVHVAAKHGHETVLGLLLARSPELVVANGRTPLHFAAENGHAKIVEKLLSHSPGLINAQDSDLKTALHLAIELGHDLVVAQLMRYKPNLELEAILVVVRDDDDYGDYGDNDEEEGEDEEDEKKQTRETKSAVYLAVEKGHDKIVTLLLANPDAALGKDNKNRTPLHLAAAKGLDSLVALLLAREPSVADVRDCDGETALHRAVKAGHTNIVAQLLAHSPATVQTLNNKQESVLHFAAERGSVEIVELLLAANAAMDAVDQDKSSVVHRAVASGCTELVELLLARKALVTDDCDNEPLIFRPVIDSHSEIVAMLLAHSPHLLDARSKRYGMNALHWAMEPEIAQQLLSLRPDLVEERDRDGVSPLYTALRNSRDKVLAQMLKQCPGVDVFRKGGQSILHVAFTMSNEQTLEVLLAHKPELIHVTLSSGTLLHCVLDRYACLMMSREFITKVWELDKQAVHVVITEETPFHIALRRDFGWAIEMMQGQLSLDEIVEACKQTQTSQDRFRHNVIIEQLLADVTEVVCEYLGFESASNRAVGKRARDD